jgi:hypothetical protein
MAKDSSIYPGKKRDEKGVLSMKYSRHLFLSPHPSQMERVFSDTISNARIPSQ